MIASESLFNDGEGAVIFSLLPGVLVSGITRTTGQGLGNMAFVLLKTALSLSWRTSALANGSDNSLPVLPDRFNHGRFEALAWDTPQSL
jgi:hypothetical protein